MAPKRIARAECEPICWAPSGRHPIFGKSLALFACLCAFAVLTGKSSRFALDRNDGTKTQTEIGHARIWVSNFISIVLSIVEAKKKWADNEALAAYLSIYP